MSEDTDELGEIAPDYEPQCNCRMTDDFKCPHCGGDMIDIEGHYVCKDCEFID